MKTLRIPVAEARKNLARVIDESANGARIKLTRYNKTVVGLVPKTDLNNLADCEERLLAGARRRRSARRSRARK